ncbi:PEP-CTERM sorting domain-containing protein [Leptothermofonsia sp. ETS-13]|uniref:PEP-CTERM sorting domain-containing protein n=1 Tax=Leptothermofonsia sp. ETS-13 TaxID=3035696 RepID=UPI003B9FEB7A
MIKSILTTPLATVVGATALSFMVATNPAQAARITYNFTINVPTGEYTGTYQGNFSYDDAVLTGKNPTPTTLESVSPSFGELEVEFNFLSVQYTEEDDAAFFSFPKVYFDNGQFVGLSFLVVASGTNPGFFIVPKQVTEFGKEVEEKGGLLVGTTNFSFGELISTLITYQRVLGGAGDPEDPEDPTAAVPEPSEIAGSLLGLGLLSLGLRLRKRNKPFQPK